MEKTLLRIIISILFICWILYVIIITINTNRKAFNKKGNTNKVVCRKKLMKSHLKKVFMSLFIFLIMILILIFVEAKY